MKKLNSGEFEKGRQHPL